MELALISVLILVVFYWLYTRWSKFNRLKKIPGPPGLPLVGHLFFIGRDPLKRFLEWKQIYGPVFQINFPGTRVLILNDITSISECFGKSEFGGRISLKLLEMLSKDGGFAITEGPEVTEQRTFLLKAFRDIGFSKSKMEVHFHGEISGLIDHFRCFNGQSFALSDAFSPYILNSLSRVLGNKRYSIPEALAINKAMLTITEADGTVSLLAMIFPQVVNLFSTNVANRLRAAEFLLQVQKDLVEEKKGSRIPGNPRDLVETLLDHVESTVDPASAFHESKKPIGPILRDIIGAAIDTSSTILEWFVIYGLHYPQVIMKLQEEIDVVIGAERLPSVEDRLKMPFAEACVLEILRITSVVPFGVPHSALKDALFRGHVIKKGTVIISNLHALHNDPKSWRQPEKFEPSRFLTHDGLLVKGAHSKILPFSTGKRSCVGAPVVPDELFLFLTSLYQNFTFRSVGELPLIKGSLGFVRHPLPGVKVIADLR